MGMGMGGALKCIVRLKKVLCDHILGEFTLYGHNQANFPNLSKI